VPKPEQLLAAVFLHATLASSLSACTLSRRILKGDEAPIHLLLVSHLSHAKLENSWLLPVLVGADTNLGAFFLLAWALFALPRNG